MNNWPNNPTIYEINTGVWLNDLSQKANQPITLGNIPQAELDRIAAYSFDAVWLMGVWQRSPAGREVSQQRPELQPAYQAALGESFQIDDVIGSPYAITAYQVEPALGGNEELAHLRQRLAALNLRLILDFVPNHWGRDQAWTTSHPDRLIQGSPDDLAREPANYFKLKPDQEDSPIFAYGRDPHFTGWPDTVQLDYRRPETRAAMTEILLDIAGRCDGVRCDMAMLVIEDIFLTTWGGQFDPSGTEFWLTAIAEVKANYPDFLFIAEVYWGQEWNLQFNHHFDYTYDKTLYDRLIQDDTEGIRNHLHPKDQAYTQFQQRMVRFIENHDEERALTQFGSAQRSRAAATIALTLPGVRLIHEGQTVGYRRKLTVELGRRLKENAEPGMESFYRKLLAALKHFVFHQGTWRPLYSWSAWQGNESYHNYIISCWEAGEECRLVAVNFGPQPAQCFVPLDISGLTGHLVYLKDLLSERHYLRDGDNLLNPGLYLDMTGYDYHIFELRRQPKP